MSKINDLLLQAEENLDNNLRKQEFYRRWEQYVKECEAGDWFKELDQDTEYQQKMGEKDAS